MRSKKKDTNFYLRLRVKNPQNIEGERKSEIDISTTSRLSHHEEECSIV